mmetsp:Transcript_55050/g.101894  ORF Transcript_55050/g.101894 Transcript_55050/m.101894 type:complete len:145 (-) Transcript_55050:136-570(-)
MGVGSSACCTKLQKNLLLEQETSTSDMLAMPVSTMEEIEKGRIASWAKPGQGAAFNMECCSSPAILADGGVGGLPHGTVAATGDGGQIIAMVGAEPDGPNWTFEQQAMPDASTTFPLPADKGRVIGTTNLERASFAPRSVVASS